MVAIHRSPNGDLTSGSDLSMKPYSKLISRSAGGFSLITGLVALIGWLALGIGGMVALITLFCVFFVLRYEITERKRIEEERERIFALSLDMLCVASSDGYFKRINPAFTRILGWTTEEILARPFIEFVHPEDRAATLREVERQTIKGERVLHFENRYQHKDGSWRLLSWTSVPQPGGFMFGSARDITERKLAEEELRASEMRYRTLFDSIDEGYCIFEMIFDDKDRPIDYRFLEINSAFEKQTGLVGAQGKTMRELAPQHESHWFEIYGRIALTGEPVRFQNRAEQLGRWYDVYAFRYGDPKNRQIAALFNDISDRKRMEETLRQSEENLAVTLQSIGDAMLATDSEGRITRINPIAEKLTGWIQLEALGKPIEEVFCIINEMTRQPAVIPVQKVLETGAIHGLANHTVLISRDGTERPIADSAAPIRDRDGRIIGVILIFRDVTEEHQKTKALLENETRLYSLNEELSKALEVATSSRDRLNAMIQAASSGVIVTDPNHQFVLLNHIAEELLNVTAQDAVGQPLDIAIKDKGLRERLRAALLKQETGAKFDIVKPGAGLGAKIVLCARTALIRDAKGVISGTITIIEDVTRERDVDRMKTEFLSTAAHELRTPLTSIRGFSEILLTRKMSEEKQRQFLDTINVQASNLANIINDLLDLARIESGRGLDLRRSATDLVSLTRELIDLFAIRSDIHQYSLDVSESQMLAHCDRDKIRQVVQNLISNATKYSPKGGRVNIQLKQDKKYVSCLVSDEGIGMTPEQVSHVFEKFYRANAGISAIEGTGLGMSIVKAIIEQHGGTVRIESELNRGTRVAFTLPLGITSGFAPAITECNSFRERRPDVKRVLVLEDDPGASSMIEFYLKEAGYLGLLANRGAGFVDFAANEQPDLICLDAILPDADGFKICERLKLDKRTKNIPVIFVSVRESEKERGMALGAHAFITKPFDAKELLAAVKDAIEGNAKLV